MRVVKDRSFYKNIFAIGIPVAMQNFIAYSTSMMDTIMLGRADDTGTLLSASSLANQPFFILNLMTFGLAGAATVLISQYWGKRDMRAIRSVLSVIIKVAFAVSLAVGLAVLLFPAQIMRIFSNNPQIVASGVEYLRIIGYAYFLFGITNTVICSIRGVELVKISVLVNVTSFAVNVFLNWVLIFGNLGAPALGIRGAAIATLVARTLEFAIITIYLFFVDDRLCIKPHHLLKFDKVLALDLFRHGWPVALVELIWALGMSLQAAVLGHVDYAAGDPVAANSITSIVQQLSTIVIFGVASAAAVLVGKSIGEGELEEAKLRAHTFEYLSVGIGLLASGVVLLLRNVAVDFYTVPESTKVLAREMMLVIALVSFFSSLGSIPMVGTLRGAGDTKFTLGVDIGSLWLVAIPLAFVSAFVFKWPVPLVLFCMKIDEPVKALLCFLRQRGNKWLRSVTRDFSPEEAETKV